MNLKLNHLCESLLASASAGAMIVAVTAQPAHAQTAQAPQVAAAAEEAPDVIPEVVVTARKRSENLLKIPVAVSALTASDLASRGIETLDDVANFTPGLTDDQANGGGARSDRSFQQLIIRGMNPSSTLNPTTSIFINGVPVASADFLQNLDDVERVEVLKGPQSAYFGRETFAGAVNTVAKSADNTLNGYVSANIGTRNTQNYTGVINVPIVDDKLALRVGYTYDTHDGSYKNQANPGETLGDQTTYSGHAAITLKPIDNLTIKAFGMMFQDDDGAPATGALIASPGSSFNQSNCTVAGQPFFCGTLPGLIRSQSPAQNTTISQGVNFANLSRAFLANPGGILGRDDLVGGFGLKRNAAHADLNIEYAEPNTGLTFTSLSGFNRDYWSEISDLSNLDGAAGGQYPGYAGFPFEVQSAAHDFSQEFRVASDPTKPYRALLGASYLESFTNQALGVTQYGTDSVTGQGSTKSETAGVFFSFAYDVLPEVTINFDGRYQADSEYSYNLTHQKVASGTTRDFLPRVSAQYTYVPDQMVYFTYSQGVNPGLFNTTFATIPTVSQNELKSLGLAGGLVVKPEDLTNYELGFKGKFFGGRATLAADIYYDKWTNQLNLNTYNFAANDPANPYNVVGGAQYVPGNKSIDPYTYTDNSASSTAKGVEAEVHFILFEHITGSLAGAYNDTQYDKFNCTTCLPYPTDPGYNAKGKFLPNAPLFSFTTGLEYSDELPALDDADWFARVDYIYKDGVYIEASNTVKTPDVNLVNLRGGIAWGNVSVEGWINNVFSNRAYTSGFQDVNFATNFGPSVVMVGLPQLITGGVKVKYIFSPEKEAPAPYTPSPLPPAPAPVAPAPAAAPTPEAHRNFQVFFDFDKSAITAEAAKVIKSAADAAKAGTYVHITVVGHTDTTGSIAYNQALSERRADAVKGELVADGVATGEIATSGVGKSDLLVPTKDGVREAQNRRATIALE